MPFDMMPEETRTDVVRLKVVRDGIAGQKMWCRFELGGRNSGEHCLLGWLLAATDWNEVEATRLAVKYLYPALPAKRQAKEIMESLYDFNDNHSRGALLQLIDRAIVRAQR